MKLTQWLLFLGAMWTWNSGCVSTTQARASGINVALNALTDAADPAYSASLTICQERAQRIVNRIGSSLPQDQHDLRLLRSRCDALFERFETLIRIQVAARRATELAVAHSSHQELATAERLLSLLTGIFREIQAWLGQLGVSAENRRALRVP